jgi:hypothetical protein
MTIELITGTPGSGKTTFAVSQRLVAESKRKITLDNETCVKLGLDPGTTVQRRLVVAGVRGLNLDHERLPHILTRDGTSPAEVGRWNAMRKERDESGKEVESDEPVHVRLPGDPPLDVPAIMQNWWLWCKPGDMIVIDEAQFVMPRGTLGRKPPFWLQAFEIHRHYGVDFLIITQHPQLIDTTVRALVGHHRHVRSIMGSPVCMVYEWDHAANPERFNLANKKPFVRRRAHYKLFHSSVAHVKPPSSGRSVFVVVPVLAAVVGWGVFHFKGKWMGQAQAAPVHAVAPLASGVQVASNDVIYGKRVSIGVPVRGCWSMGPEHCECIGDGGRRLMVDSATCHQSAAGFDGLVQWEPQRGVRYEDRSAAATPSAGASAPKPALIGAS